MRINIEDNQIKINFGAPSILSAIMYLSLIVVLASVAFFIYFTYINEENAIKVILGIGLAGLIITLIMLAIIKNFFKHSILIDRVTNKVIIEQSGKQAQLHFENFKQIEISREVNYTSSDVGNRRKIIQIWIRLERFFGPSLIISKSSKVKHDLIEKIREFTRLPVIAYTKNDGNDKKEHQFFEEIKTLNAKIVDSKPAPSNAQELKNDRSTRFMIQPPQNTYYKMADQGNSLEWKTRKSSIIILIACAAYCGTAAYYFFPGFVTYPIAIVALVFILLAFFFSIQKAILTFDTNELIYSIKGARGKKEWAKVKYNNIQALVGDLNKGTDRGLMVKKLTASEATFPKSTWRIIKRLTEDYEFFPLEGFSLIEKLQVEKMLLEKIFRKR